MNILPFSFFYLRHVDLMGSSISCSRTCFFKLRMYVMGEGLGKTSTALSSGFFHSLELWVNLFLLATLVLMSSQGYVTDRAWEKCSHPWGIFFYSQQLTKVYNARLKLARLVIFLPPSDVYVRSFSFSVTITLIKFLVHKAISDWDCLWSKS